MDFTDTALGIELGSTRIKAVLIDKNHLPIASGSFEWENQLINGVWTYPMDMVHEGLRACFKDIKRDVKQKFGVPLKKVGAIGVSAMMHGYLPFDKDGRQLAEFRTWRNTMTGEAAAKLSDLFGFSIPQRWSIAHLYQAMLNGEAHVKDIAYLTTLAGYIHWRLTGEKLMGIGEASGMFPIDSSKMCYDEAMLEKFRQLTGVELTKILPEIRLAGQSAGTLTSEGALFLDPDGELESGIPVAPCEGDAGTGMTATNSVRVRTGNVSAGTSDFVMIVADKPMAPHKGIDMVTTPAGLPVAMVHGANCTSDINAWVGLFDQFAESIGVKLDKGDLFTLLYKKALEGDADCGGLLSFNYLSGEGMTGFDEGRPVFMRTPDAKLTLANFMRTHLLSALSTLKIGLDLLKRLENIQIDRLYAHGGFFKTPGVGQRLMSAAINAPVSVMETAGEGGPYGMALLAAFMLSRQEGETLEDYLDQKVFKDAKSVTLMADESDIRGINAYLDKFVKAIPVERAAVEHLAV